MRLTTAQKKQLAQEFNVDYPLLLAFMEVESAGDGFFTDWHGKQRIKIQFEPHWFAKYKDTWINNGVRPQREEWEAFNQAARISLEAAMLSTSWGLGQVMGFNHKLIGFKTVGAMVDAFKESEYNQARGMLMYCKNKRGMLEAMQGFNYQEMARLYNGQQYAKYSYDKRIEASHGRHKAKLNWV